MRRPLLTVVPPTVGSSSGHNGHSYPNAQQAETMEQRILRIKYDLQDLKDFYNMEFSPKRRKVLQKYCTDELKALHNVPFGSYRQQDKVDYLLLKSFLDQNLQEIRLVSSRYEAMAPLISFAPMVVRLCEDRQEMKRIHGQKAAQSLHELVKQILEVKETVEKRKEMVDKFTAFRAAKTIDQLRLHLKEWYGFFNGYDPLFTWWVKLPYEEADAQLELLAATVREKIVGITPGDEDVIVGEPIGHEALLADLLAEQIAYTPEEIIRIGEIEYEWCEREMKKASQDLGYGDDWKKALEHVKNTYVEPGKQPQLIRDLALEAIEYIEEHNMITVPAVAKTWRMYMMTPEQQKVSPFFLGGDYIQVSYPTDAMDHEAKLMSMRGNNPHFSRSTVFHELIPGHNLQFYYNKRVRPYRFLFNTPFCIEGWAFYWELILWDRGFAESPEDRIGMLFWHMHRCARIIFSFKFHLGQMTPQECIDLLVDKVGHERANAEGEVRRSFNGDWSPLYQAAYMLGALQIYSLRQELVVSGKVGEKDFHNRFLHENQMPIELMRALMKNQTLKRDFKPSWRFYDQLDDGDNRQNT
jgi:uncharacterized protein (DUF885 family)